MARWRSGTWFSIGNDRLGQGRENAKQFLRDNKDVFAKLEARVRKELGLTREAQEPVEAPVEKEKPAPARK